MRGALAPYPPSATYVVSELIHEMCNDANLLLDSDVSFYSIVCL